MISEGICPACGNECLNYGTIEIEGDSVYYPFTCEKCKAQGREWYNLTYIETELTSK